MAYKCNPAKLYITLSTFFSSSRVRQYELLKKLQMNTVKYVDILFVVKLAVKSLLAELYHVVFNQLLCDILLRLGSVALVYCIKQKVLRILDNSHIVFISRSLYSKFFIIGRYSPTGHSYTYLLLMLIKVVNI